MTTITTSMPEVPADDFVTKSTVASATAAVLASERTSDAVAAALSLDGAAFRVAAISTYAVIESGKATAKTLAAAFKSAGVVGFTSGPSVGYLRMVGDLFANRANGDLAADFVLRDFLGMYRRTQTIEKGAKAVSIAVKPAQHEIVLAKAGDLKQAFSLLGAVCAANLADERKKLADRIATSAAKVADDATDGATDSTDSAELAELVVISPADFVTKSLTDALALLTGVRGLAHTVGDEDLMSEIFDTLEILIDQRPVRAAA